MVKTKTDTRLKVITQNCFFGKTANQVSALINKNQPDVCCLQEVTGIRFANTIKEKTLYNYLLSDPIKTPIPGLTFHNAIFTKLKISEHGELNWNKTRRMWVDKFGGKSLWAKITKGETSFIIYSCYFAVTDQGMEERKTMITEIAENAIKYKSPVIICGDMNTTIPNKGLLRFVVQSWHRFPTPNNKILGKLADKNERYLFLNTVSKFGFKELGDFHKNTWREMLTGKELFSLKLDWMLYRNCSAISSKLGRFIGDHKAIIGNLSLPQGKLS
jgi:endonuclease/exonuclease/phosphatase family metal-dependent hydrolase